MPQRYDYLKSSSKDRLRKFINHPVMDGIVIVLILLSVALIAAENYFVGNAYKKILEHINQFLTLLFSLELFLRFWAEKRKARFFKSYWLDIIAVLAPLYRSLRILRVLRLLRIFRAGKLLNRRFNTIQSWVHHGLFQHLWLLFVLLTLTLAGAASFRLIEPHNEAIGTFREALWWSIFTMIGGESLTGAPAQTNAGRLITLFVVLAGLITFAALTGIIAAVMINRLKPQMEQGDMDLEALENHVVICGWNRSVNLLLRVLQNSEEHKDREIILVGEFKEDEPYKNLNKEYVHFSSLYVIRGDFTRLDILERAGIKRASEAIVMADDLIHRSDQDRDARSILSAMLIEKMNPEIFTCVELLNRDNAGHLSMIGVEEILVADEYAGTILGNAQRTRGIITMLDELFDPSTGNQFYKVPIPDDWLGKTVGEIHQILKNKFNATLVSLETRKEGKVKILVNPESVITLKEGDKIVLISQKRLDFRHLNRSA